MKNIDHYTFVSKLREICQQHIQGEFKLSCCNVTQQEERFTQYNVHTKYSCPKFKDLMKIPEGIKIKVYGE